MVKVLTDINYKNDNGGNKRMTEDNKECECDRKVIAIEEVLGGENIEVLGPGKLGRMCDYRIRFKNGFVSDWHREQVQNIGFKIVGTGSIIRMNDEGQHMTESMMYIEDREK